MSDFMSSGESRKLAESEGLDVYIPKANELTLDLDNVAAEIVFKSNLERYCSFFQIFMPHRETTSRNGGKHVFIEWPEDLDVPTKCAIQATLGSDLLREMNSIFRWLAKDPEPIMLFEVRK